MDGSIVPAVRVTGKERVKKKLIKVDLGKKSRLLLPSLCAIMMSNEHVVELSHFGFISSLWPMQCLGTNS